MTSPGRLALLLSLLLPIPAHGVTMAVPTPVRVARAVTLSLPSGLAVGQVRAPELPAGDLVVEWQAGAPRAGWVNLMARVLSGSKELAHAWVRVELKELHKVVVAARPLAAGALVASEDLELAERAAGPLPGLRSSAGLVGLRLVRNLQPGELVLETDILRPPPLPRGTPIKFLVKRGAVLVTADATLERAARPGEMAAVRITASGHQLQGRLVDETTVVAEGGAP